MSDQRRVLLTECLIQLNIYTAFHGACYKFYLRFIVGLLQCVALPGKRNEGESKETEVEVILPNKDKIAKFTSLEDTLESGLW